MDNPNNQHQNRKRHVTEISLAPKLLDRYVAKEFLFGYIVALAVVLSLRTMLDLVMEFDEFTEEKGGLLTVLAGIFDYYGPKLFEYFRDFSGMIILLAAVFSLVRMTRNNELTAVLASGISLKRLIMPIVLLGFALNFLAVLNQELILPRLANKLVRGRDESIRLKKMSVPFMLDRDESLLSAHQYDHQTKTLYDMLVILRRDQQMIGRITATQAVWDDSAQAWLLQDGQYFTDATDLEQQPEFVRQPIDQYQSAFSADVLWLFLNGHSKSLMSTPQLTDLLRWPLKPGDRAEALSEKHFRFTDPIINMVMLLVSLPLLVSREQRSTKTSIFLATAGAGGCYIATFVCKLLAAGSLTPMHAMFAAWLPIIVFLPLSVLALDSLKT